MRISTRGRYGLRIMMELAAHYGEGPVLVEMIAGRQGISGKYIHVLVTGLKAAGLVQAVRGPKGGYELTREPDKIMALDIVRALEGNSAPAECVADASTCVRADHCAARDLWCEVAAAVDGVLSSYTLERLAAMDKARQENSAMYHI